MPIVLAPLGWGLIVAGVGLAAAASAHLISRYQRHDFRGRPSDPPITIEDIQREIERIRRTMRPQGQRDPERDPQMQPDRRLPRPWPDLDLGTREQGEPEETRRQRLRRRCYEDEGDCPTCPPAEDGTPYMRRFQAGTVGRPAYSAMGAVYQHYVVPWFSFGTEVAGADESATLRVDLEEWKWKGDARSTWDGLDFLSCTLIECKFGYGRYVNVDVLADDPRQAPITPGPQGRADSNLEAAWGAQLDRQIAKVQEERDAEHSVWLRWVFSNPNVRSVFNIMTSQRRTYWVSDRHIPMSFSVIRDTVEREIDMETSDPSEDYGNWGAT